jgi:hypothetical protein
LQWWLRGAWGRGFPGAVAVLRSMQYFHLATGHLVLDFCSLCRFLTFDCEEVVLELEVCSRHAGVSNCEKKILSNRPELVDASFCNMFGSW